MARAHQFVGATVASLFVFGSQLPSKGIGGAGGVGRLGGTAFAAPAVSGPGISPIPTGACNPHLTRAADLTITMLANKQSYKATLDVAAKPPQTFYPPYSTVVSGGSTGCTRSVVDIVAPSSASSGCAQGKCSEYAEVLTGAAQFTNSKLFEEHFYVMKDTVSEAYCKSYRHDVVVYVKKNGETTFTKADKSFIYRGRWENSKCRVYATYLGQVWDTPEVYTTLKPPAAGTDVIRIVESLTIDNAPRNIITVVEFEEQ